MIWDTDFIKSAESAIREQSARVAQVAAGKVGDVVSGVFGGSSAASVPPGASPVGASSPPLAASPQVTLALGASIPVLIALAAGAYFIFGRGRS